MTTPPVYKESYLPGPQNTLFYTRTYTPPAPTPAKALIIFIHGFNEHIARYTHIHTPLSQHRGFAIFTFDQRGFGKTAAKEENGGGKRYALTSWKEQLEDIEWAIGEGRKVEGCESVPVFLMGHSMGGGLSLAFPTRKGPLWPQPSPETVSLLSGVIASSPWLTLTTAPPFIKRWAGEKASAIAPRMIIPAIVKGEDLSHNPEVGEAVNKDPLIKQVGSLRALSNMLSGGEKLLTDDYKNWPKSLPLLIIHGTDDRVTNPKSSQAFVDKIDAEDKKISLFEGMYHEIHNEIDEAPEKYMDEIVAWVEARVGGSGAGEGTAVEGGDGAVSKL